ncbi:MULTISPECIES: PD-(D/E)XK motif protein [Streptomyces]|uniref:PD-(D/E)XK motif protein n=1 Tax=Streptomyces rochei TaxID=1928 RepID=A0ABW7E2J5_STRRO|nr:PD-(D/E)XK motif protein [Streptomyces sp. MBT28]
MTRHSEAWQTRLRAHWSVLNARRTPKGVVTSGLGLTVGDDAEVLVGVDARGDHHLLVPVDVRSAPVEDYQAAYIRIQRCTLVVDGRSRIFTDVVCHRPDLSELFDDILAAMLVELGAGSGQRPDIVCKHVLDEWRELLRRRGGLLGDDALRGIFGELIVLEKILTASPGNGLSAWRGPDREPHDFRLNNGDLEVKTLGDNGSTVRIHGIGQLEPPTGGTLHLIVVRLSVTSDGLALPDLVERLQSKVADRKAFAVALARCGYSQMDADHYRDRRFTVAQITALPIDEAFPCIVPSSLSGVLPKEVSNLSYSLDLSLLLPLATLTGHALTPLFVNGSLS